MKKVKIKKFFQKIGPTLPFFQLIPSPTGKTWDQLELWDIPGLFHTILTGFIGILGIYALIAIIWGAYQYLTAYGNEERAQKGKSIVLYSVIGVAIAVLAWVFVDVVWVMITGGVAPERP